MVVGHAGQRGAVLQAVRVDVGDWRRDLRRRRRGSGVVPGVGSRPVALQLGVVHQLRGDAGLAGVSQSVLHRPLQLHPPVLEPVSDLEKRVGRMSKVGFIYKPVLLTIATSAT